MSEGKKCCRCGGKENITELKDVVGGDDWNWWCQTCLNEQMDWMKTQAYLHRCECLLKRSNCLLIHFGSVLVNNGEIIGEGYNLSVNNCKVCLKKKIPKYKVGKNPAICYAIHSEWMAIIDALSQGHNTHGATLYIIGRYPDGRLWKSNFFACTVCARLLKYCGIKRIVGLQFEGKPKVLSMTEAFKSAYVHILSE